MKPNQRPIKGDPMTVLSIVRPSAKPATGNLSAVADLLGQWKKDADRLEELDAGSVTMPLRRKLMGQLEKALVAAQHAPAWMSVAQAHKQLRVPASTIRYYCKTSAASIGAEKHGGMWRIDARSFEAFLARPQVRNTSKAA